MHPLVPACQHALAALAFLRCYQETVAVPVRVLFSFLSCVSRHPLERGTGAQALHHGEPQPALLSPFPLPCMHAHRSPQQALLPAVLNCFPSNTTPLIGPNHGPLHLQHVWQPSDKDEPVVCKDLW